MCYAKSDEVSDMPNARAATQSSSPLAQEVAEDKAIIREVDALSMLVSQHVDNFYSEKAVEDLIQLIRKISEQLAPLMTLPPAAHKDFTNQINNILKPSSASLQHLRALYSKCESIADMAQSQKSTWSLDVAAMRGNGAMVFPPLKKVDEIVRRGDLLQSSPA